MAHRSDRFLKKDARASKSAPTSGGYAAPEEDLAAMLQNAPSKGGMTPETVMQLQRTIGNRAVVSLATSKPTVQRVLWEANDALEWETVYIDESGATPNVNATAAGQIYDDMTGIMYPNMKAYQSSLANAVLNPTSDMDEDEDELGDTEFKNEEDESDSDEDDFEEEEEEDQSTSVNDGKMEMTFDDRKAEEEKGLKQPVLSSTLTPSSGKYKTKQFATYDKFKRKGEQQIQQRDPSSGPVTITLETIQLWVNDEIEEYVRPIEIEGLVEPTETKGREGAPDPLSGVQIYMGQKGQLKESVPVERNMGLADAERGHIMALELGGPDLPENIVPQWAKFQGTGDWRKMEVSVLEAAEAAAANKNKLKYKVTVYYKSSGILTPTLQTFGFPVGFRATTQLCDAKGQAIDAEQVVFNQGQSQDSTDTMLFEREAQEVEKSEWDSSLNVPKAKGKKRQSVKTYKKSNSGKKAKEKTSKKKKDDLLKKKRGQK